MRVSSLIGVFSACVAVALSKPSDKLSFSSPFDGVSYDGTRAITGWHAGGNTVVNKNFVRLTADRQSQQGALWSEHDIASDELALELTFRISGQGARLFGDGIGLWITEHAFLEEGPIHGMTEEFTGIGIILDTFKNAETAAQHRDVLVLVNDGSKTLEEMVEEPVGCDADFRYHEGRADFSVKNGARLRLTVRANKLSVHIDESNSGDYEVCTTVKSLGLPFDWLRKSRIGLTASTGALADNHDVVQLKTYLSVPEADRDLQLEQQGGAPKPPPARAANAVTFNKMAKEMEELRKDSDVFKHYLEHELLAVQDSMRNSLRKLQEEEDKSDARIEELEEKMEKTLKTTIKERVSRLESVMGSRMNRKLTHRIQDIERAVNKKVFESFDEEASNAGASSWKTPFMIIVVLLIVAGLAGYQWYQQLRKTHLL